MRRPHTENFSVQRERTITAALGKGMAIIALRDTSTYYNPSEAIASERSVSRNPQERMRQRFLEVAGVSI